MGNKSSKRSKNQPDTISAKVNDKPVSDWLLVMGDFEVKLIKKCLSEQLSKKIKTGYELFIPDYTKINIADEDVLNTDAAKGGWEYYRDVAAYSARNPQIQYIPKMAYFVFAQFHQNTISNKIIPESLRLSLLNNLSILSRDDAVKYDLRDSNTGQYLYYKTMKFGIKLPDIVKMLDMNKEWLSAVNDKIDFEVDLSNQFLKADMDDPDDEQVEVTLKVDDYKIEPQFDDNGCIIYKIKSSRDKDRNTAFIHDMIDPNKNLFENRLWIPAIFDCEKKVDIDNNFEVGDVIKSSIVGLDYTKYKGLYTDIAKVFKMVIQPMFENVLNYKLGKKEKIIVKSMKYVLQKPGDFYEGMTIYSYSDNINFMIMTMTTQVIYTVKEWEKILLVLLYIIHRLAQN